MTMSCSIIFKSSLIRCSIGSGTTNKFLTLRYQEVLTWVTPILKAFLIQENRLFRFKTMLLKFKCDNGISFKNI